MVVTPDNPPALLVVGGLHVDEVATVQGKLVERASNPVCWQRYVGGVASNAARAAQEQYNASGHGTVMLHCALGNDDPGRRLIAAMQSHSISVTPQWVDDGSTDRYSAIIASSGELLIGLADVQLAEKLCSSTAASVMKPDLVAALLIDTNLSSQCIDRLLEAASVASISAAALTVSPAKAVKLLPFAPRINLLFCNRREALALAVASTLLPADTQADGPELQELAQALSELGFSEFVLTDGDAPLLVSRGGCYTNHISPQVPITHNVNGAGDALAGATLAAVTLGAALEEAVVKHGLRIAAQVITGKRPPLAIE